ncbi:hypothetical protein [Microbacterium neungamense]|uniref:hypothetical protein n=1 Tax=Microbacterium neungamense TaxID=2810535 RepID=UPI00217D342C|nr:hypothetical protein [Microbacterium neungamense]UWF77606.1 hypothetical protein JSY13_00480 [Microbacterium neungamense]
MTHADVTTPADADALAARILQPRERPLVLVSTDHDGGYAFDVDRLRAELDGIADVITLATGTASKRLESLVPPKTQVFNGAARSYPPDFGANPNWTRSHLRFPGQAGTDDLIHDAMAQTGRRTVESAPGPGIRRARGIVQGFVADGTRAIVRLDDGTAVTATATLLPPDVPLIAALVVGEPVSGVLEGGELHPEPLVPDLDVFTDGAHTLALVVKVTELRATVQLHPRLPVVLRRRDVGAEDRPVSDLLAVGDVVRVRVHRKPGGEIALSVADADPEAPLVPPLALVAGGAPWLSEDRPRPSDSGTDAEQPASAAHRDRGAEPATRHDVAALAHEVAALRSDLLALTNLVARSNGSNASNSGAESQLRAENERLRAHLAQEKAERAGAEARLAELSEDRRETGRALRDARRAAERAHVDPTPEGIRLEIERTWGIRTAPGERTRWPLREYSLGPGFIDSLAGLDETQLSKAVRACVDAITGRDREIPARELHRLRTGEGGDDAYVVRADGGRCWRSSIEQNAPGARRLHYWELPGGVIELSRVVHHDDTRP